MSLIKKAKIVIVSIAVLGIAYFLFSGTSLANSNNLSNKSGNNNQRSYISESISGVKFALNFVDSEKSENYFKHVDKILTKNESYDSKLLSKKNESVNNVQPKNYTMNFDENVIAVVPMTGISPDKDPENNSNSIVINDREYSQNNTQNMESGDGYGETIFVTDDIMSQLVSCKESKGIYTCHGAVSNLNNPQDVLVIGNYIYIINSHKQGESGDITRCSINSVGYISSCGQQQINMINPVFFYYNSPYIYISDFVYLGGGIKPKHAIQCMIDNNGSFINCNEDHDITSMEFLSKYYNNSYYRPHSYQGVYIEKCTTADALYCDQMTNKMLISPLSLSINHDRIFISNTNPSLINAEILKCSMDMESCSVVTRDIKSPMCIAIYNFLGS